MNITAFSYNQQTINQREDSYLCASQMCQANNKKLNDWTRLKSTQEYILELSVETGIPQRQLIEVKHGNQTWIHPCLFSNLQTWIEQSPKQKKGLSFEVSVQNKLHQLLGGEKEVLTKTGKIDLLTKTQVIEVKDVKNWKDAIGQVLIYQLEFPEKKARIHLFGKCSNDMQNLIISYASKLNVIATFE